jgi:hypothetical protein
VTGRGWESVVVVESDVLACGGFLPEKYTGSVGGGDIEAETAVVGEDEGQKLETVTSEAEGAETTSVADVSAGGVGEVTQEERADAGALGCDEGVGGDGGLTLVDRGHPLTAAEGDSCPTTGEECVKLPNEPNFGADVCIAQNEDIIENPANSGGSSGLDKLQTEPILETKPIAAGGPDVGGPEGSTKPEARLLKERERRGAWMEIARQEWIRSRAEKEARMRERAARVAAGVANGGVDSGGAAMPSQDVRGP